MGQSNRGSKKLATHIGVVAALSVVLLTVAVVVATSFSAHAALLHQVDQQLTRMANVKIVASAQALSTDAGGSASAADADVGWAVRAGTGEGAVRTGSSGEGTRNENDGSGRGLGHGDGSGSAPGDGPGDDSGRGPGRGPGGGMHLPQRQPGALQVVVSNGAVVSSTLFSEVAAMPLAAGAVAKIRAVPVAARPQTVDLGALGNYRVIARTQAGVTQYLGLTLRDVDQATAMVAWWAGGVGTVAAALAVVAIVLVVRRTTRPLAKVAAAASEMANTDLVNGSGQAVARVAVDPRRDASEIVQVAQALNGLLDQVTDALRQRNVKEEQLRQFVADASHELRTPLAAVKGYAQLGQRSGEPLAALVKIDTQATQMTGLVEDLLALARLDAGRVETPEAVAIGDFALSALTDAAVSFPDHDWSFDDSPAALAAGKLIVRIAPAQLRRILQNLVANAARHTPAGTAVRVSVAVLSGAEWLVGAGAAGGAGAAQSFVAVDVADTGPGVAPELREHVFDRFVCGDSSRTGSSSGLGLSLARSLARAAGGDVILLDTERGATFRVLLPVVA